MQAIIEELFTRLRTNAALQALFAGGDVLVFNQWAEQDAEPPYIVLELSAGGPTDELYAQKSGDLVVTVWDRASSEADCLEIVGAVRNVLSRTGFDATSGAAKAIWIGTPYPDQAVPDPEPDLWRRETVYPISFWDAAEVSAVTSR
jgi:hypothetical protein